MQPIYIPYSKCILTMGSELCTVAGEERMKMVRVDLINNFGYG